MKGQKRENRATETGKQVEVDRNGEEHYAFKKLKRNINYCLSTRELRQ